jgi:hypothetical protein
VWVGVTAVLFVLHQGAAARAQQPAETLAPQTTESARLAPALALIPADAAGFMHVRIADLWQSAALAELRGILVKAGPQAWQLFEQKYSPAPSQIESVTVIYLTADSMGEPIFDGPPDRVSPILVVTTIKPFDQAKLTAALGPDAKPARHEGQRYFRVVSSRSAFQFVDDRTFVAASVKGLRRWLERPTRAGKAGALQEALREANRKHTWVAGFNPALLPKQPFGPFVPPKTFSQVADQINGKPAPVNTANPLWETFAQPLLKARCITVTFDLGSDLRGSAKLDFGSADDADHGAVAIRTGLQAARGAISVAIAEAQRDLRDGPQLFVPVGQAPTAKPAGPKTLFRASDQAIGDIAALVQLGALRGMDERLQAVTIERQASMVRVGGSTPLSGSELLLSLTAIAALGRNTTTTFQTVGDSIGPAPVDNKGGPDLAAVVPPGKRAVAIRVRADNIEFAQAILPLSRVSVIWSRAQGKGETQTEILVEDALVVAVDVLAADQKMTVVTLALSPEDAARVVAAQETGSLSIALRPLAEPKR